MSQNQIIAYTIVIFVFTIDTRTAARLPRKLSEFEVPALTATLLGNHFPTAQFHSKGPLVVYKMISLGNYFLEKLLRGKSHFLWNFLVFG